MVSKLENKQNLLKFNDASKQAKLSAMSEWLGYKPKVYTFSLPAGVSCPAAVDCLSYSDRVTGKITDGKHTQFRCFMASIESIFPPARAQYHHNFDLLRKLKDVESMVNLIMDSLPKKFDIMRVHVGGDYFNERYLKAWIQVAALNPDKTFYSYTKSIQYWVKNIDNIPPNLILNGSRGGRFDTLLDEFSLKTAEVVFSLEEAESKGLKIDHNEELAIKPLGNFGLLIHGTQPKGSKAAAAKKLLQKNNIKHSYSRKKAAAVV